MSLVIDGDSAINITEVDGKPRIIGDFSNATYTSRALFQSSTTNGQTSIGVVPNGTSTSSSFIATGASDPTNTSYAGLLNTGTEARFASGILGSGSYIPMTFYTGGSERVRIDTGGNVTIGTSSSATNDQVGGGRPLVVSRSDSSTTIAGSTANIVIANLDTTTNNTSQLSFATITGANSTLFASAAINCIFGARTNGQYSTGQLTFSTSSSVNVAPTEKMRIDSSGNLLVGTTTSSGYRVVLGYEGTTLSGIDFRDTSNSGTTYPLAFRRNTSTVVGSISCSTTTTSYNTSSDYRLKENIQPMQDALATIQQLNPVTYTWKADGSDGQGFIAHELQAVVPDCVTGTKDATDEEGNPVYQGIDTSFLVATLTKAIQELKTELDNAKERIAVLENK